MSIDSRVGVVVAVLMLFGLAARHAGDSGGLLVGLAENFWWRAQGPGRHGGVQEIVDPEMRKGST